MARGKTKGSQTNKQNRNFSLLIAKQETKKGEGITGIPNSTSNSGPPGNCITWLCQYSSVVVDGD